MVNKEDLTIILWGLIFYLKFSFGVRSLRGVIARVLDWNVVVSEFEIQSNYYVHFRTNIFGKNAY